MPIPVHMISPPEEIDLQTLHAVLDSSIAFSVGAELKAAVDVHILVTGHPERDHLLACPKLKALVVPFAGFPERTRRLMLDFPHIAVYNLHYNAAPTAEMALALLLAAAKFIVPIDRTFRSHDWSPRYEPDQSIILDGKTALILGFGHIGQRVGSYCQALGMRLLAIRRRPGREVLPGLHAEVSPPGMLHELLPQADALIITLPFTPQTDGLIGAEELALLPRDALLVNVGRGRIVDQAALYQALKDGTILAAGLDVWYNYPSEPGARQNTPPADHPFHELDNVVMSPHRGGDSTASEALRMAHLASLLNALARGDPVENRVDVQAGY
jgi:phosphoglycerate dehydrogenase-like enzyme